MSTHVNKKKLFNFKMFVITTELPDGKNFFGNIYHAGTDDAKDGLTPGAKYNVWETNIGFARRFKTHTEAQNFLDVVIKLDGCQVEELSHEVETNKLTKN